MFHKNNLFCYYSWLLKICTHWFWSHSSSDMSWSISSFSSSLGIESSQVIFTNKAFVSSTYSVSSILLFPAPLFNQCVISLSFINSCYAFNHLWYTFIKASISYPILPNALSMNPWGHCFSLLISVVCYLPYSVNSFIFLDPTDLFPVSLEFTRYPNWPWWW